MLAAFFLFFGFAAKTTCFLGIITVRIFDLSYFFGGFAICVGFSVYFFDFCLYLRLALLMQAG